MNRYIDLGSREGERGRSFVRLDGNKSDEFQRDAHQSKSPHHRGPLHILTPAAWKTTFHQHDDDGIMVVESGKDDDTDKNIMFFNNTSIKKWITMDRSLFSLDAIFDNQSTTSMNAWETPPERTSRGGSNDPRWKTVMEPPRDTNNHHSDNHITFSSSDGTGERHQPTSPKTCNTTKYCRSHNTKDSKHPHTIRQSWKDTKKHISKRRRSREIMSQGIDGHGDHQVGKHEQGIDAIDDGSNKNFPPVMEISIPTSEYRRRTCNNCNKNLSSNSMLGLSTPTGARSYSLESSLRNISLRNRNKGQKCLFLRDSVNGISRTTLTSTLTPTTATDSTMTSISRHHPSSDMVINTSNIQQDRSISLDLASLFGTGVHSNRSIRSEDSSYVKAKIKTGRRVSSTSFQPTLLPSSPTIHRRKATSMTTNTRGRKAVRELIFESCTKLDDDPCARTSRQSVSSALTKRMSEKLSSDNTSFASSYGGSDFTRCRSSASPSIRRPRSRSFHHRRAQSTLASQPKSHERTNPVMVSTRYNSNRIYDSERLSCRNMSSSPSTKSTKHPQRSPITDVMDRTVHKEEAWARTKSDAQSYSSPTWQRRRSVLKNGDDPPQHRNVASDIRSTRQRSSNRTTKSTPRQSKLSRSVSPSLHRERVSLHRERVANHRQNLRASIHSMSPQRPYGKMMCRTMSLQNQSQHDRSDNSTSHYRNGSLGLLLRSIEPPLLVDHGNDSVQPNRVMTPAAIPSTEDSKNLTLRSSSSSVRRTNRSRNRHSSTCDNNSKRRNSLRPANAGRNNRRMPGNA